MQDPNEILLSLIAAAKSNDLSKVKSLIEEGTDPDVVDLNYNTALVYAVNNNSPEITNVLLQAGATVIQKNIERARDNKNKKIEELLLATYGADLEKIRTDFLVPETWLATLLNEPESKITLLFHRYQRYLCDELVPKKDKDMWKIARKLSLIASGGLKGWILFKLENDLDFRNKVEAKKGKEAVEKKINICHAQITLHDFSQEELLQRAYKFSSDFSIFLEGLPFKINQNLDPMSHYGKRLVFNFIKSLVILIIALFVFPYIGAYLILSADSSPYGRFSSRAGSVCLVGGCTGAFGYFMYQLISMFNQKIRSEVLPWDLISYWTAPNPPVEKMPINYVKIQEKMLDMLKEIQKSLRNFWPEGDKDPIENLRSVSDLDGYVKSFRDLDRLLKSLLMQAINNKKENPTHANIVFENLLNFTFDEKPVEKKSYWSGHYVMYRSTGSVDKKEKEKIPNVEIVKSIYLKKTV